MLFTFWKNENDIYKVENLQNIILIQRDMLAAIQMTHKQVETC